MYGLVDRAVGRLLGRFAGEVVGRLSTPAWLVDADGGIVRINSAACSAFELDSHAVTGSPFGSLKSGAWDFADLVRAVERSRARAAEPLMPLDSFEHELKGAGHRQYRCSIVVLRGRWFDTGLVVLVLHDETARREAEARVRDVLAAAPDGILVVDASGRIELVNRHATHLFGYEEAELIGAQVEVLVPEPHQDRHPVHRFEFAADPKVRPMAAGLELSARHKDGSAIPVDISLSPLQADAGLRVIVAVRDVRERRAAQLRHAALEAQLHDARRLEAMGRLAGGVAHDFNNILTAILGYADIATETLAESEPAHSAIAEIRTAGQRAAVLVHQLLIFGRRQVLQPVVVDLNSLIEHLMPMLRPLIREDIEVSLMLAPELGRVRVDRASFELVATNLIVNAVDALPVGGLLTVETANVELDEDYASTHGDVVPGSYVALSVTDNGVGIEPALIGRVFEPFFTTKDPGVGAGIGLASVQSLVRQSGGSVWAYSEPNVGSTFKVYLPRVDEALEDGQELAAPAPRPGGGTETILIVEDDAAIRGFMRRVLEGYGYRVLLAERGDRIPPDVDANPMLVDLLVTDIVMPGILGPELALRLRARHPGLRVLYISGYAQNAIVNQGVLDAGVDFVGKPFGATDLARRVREALDRPPPSS